MAPIGIEWIKAYVLSPSVNDTTIRVGRFIPGHFVAMVAYIKSSGASEGPSRAFETKLLDASSEALLMNELKKWIEEKFGKDYSLAEIKN